MYHAEKQDVEDFFMKFGPIRDVWVARRPPGFAYVTFEKAEDAENAIREGNDGMIGDEKIRVELARPRVGMHFDSDLKKTRSDRRHSRSRSYSRHSGHRSDSRGRDRHSRRDSRSHSRSRHSHRRHSHEYRHDSRDYHRDSRRDRSRSSRRSRRLILTVAAIS